jgi:CheY-like chemotaxis protein/two-component sensor histidine kinase
VARGVVTLSRSPIELSDIASQAIETASPLLEQRAQELVVSVPKTGLAVNADPIRMAQVVANLLTNASKYTPPRGHVWLTASREGDDAVIRVRDDGEGIPADLLPNVFNLFVQGTRTIARSEGGLGLGLALVKSFVALHSGTVTATSEGTGQGSEFVVRLPALRLAVPLIQPVRTPSIPIHPGKRILLVDDNLDAGEMLAELLRAIGHDVELAGDGPTALKTLQGFEPEVAILDIGLPVMDGFELARRIRERSPTPPRLIALTGYGRDADIAQSRASGFEAHLVKPVEVPMLVAALDPTLVTGAHLRRPWLDPAP